MRTIHALLLAKKIPFTYSKREVIRLTSQIPQRHFPKDMLSQQRKTQTSLHVRAIRSRATGAAHRHRRMQIKPFSNGNTGPQRRLARVGHDHKTDAIFSICFTKCLRNKIESVSNTKIIFLNENV